MALTDSLVAYYKFETGALTTDSSGNGQTLTNQNSVAESASGLIGYCADNGNTSNTKGFYRDSGGLTYTQLGTAWTINIWAKNNDTTVDTIVMRNSATNGSLERSFSFWIPQVATPRIMCSCFDGAGHDAVYNVTLTQGAWYMYSAVYNGTDLRLYLNGTQVGTPLTFSWSGYARNTLHILAIGTYKDTTGDTPYASLRGLYDECGMWSRALSSTEITSLYRETQGNQFPFGSAFNNTLTPSARAGSGISVTERTM